MPTSGLVETPHPQSTTIRNEGTKNGIESLARFFPAFLLAQNPRLSSFFFAFSSASLTFAAAWLPWNLSVSNTSPRSYRIENEDRGYNHAKSSHRSNLVV